MLRATELIEYHLADRTRRGPAPAGWANGAAGGAPCGDLVRLSLDVGHGRVEAVRFDAEGCSAAIAAGAATAALAEGSPVLDAARIGPAEVAAELGGLSAQGRHAADLAADALHRALSAAMGQGAAFVAEDGWPRGERVAVAMSGGVDSAVAAHLERERGADVVALTVKLWADRVTDGARSCCSPEAVVGARAIAHSMGIPHLTLDLEERFRASVVGEFVAEHEAGRTPNPCVICNGEVRLDAMLDLGERLGAGALATGHYARVAEDAEGPLLVAPADVAKDQTYMLSALSPHSLARLRFPLAELTKPEVREIAAAAGLSVASKAESQDLCFLAGEGKRSFLERNGRLRERAGEIVAEDGAVLGSHRGHHRFTVGQRRGIGVAGPTPLYVLATDAAANRVVVGPRERLATERVRVTDAVLHRDGARVDRVRLRYHSRPLGASLESGGGAAGLPGAGSHPELTLRLEEPAYGVAPGQTASLMDADAVIGHATVAAAAR
jgi:tRNA-uridine 2-sulfurtransferase